MRARRSHAYSISARGLHAFRSMKTAASNVSEHAARLQLRPSAISEVSCISGYTDDEEGKEGTATIKRKTLSGGEALRVKRSQMGAHASLESKASSGIIGAVGGARYRVSI